MKTLQKFLTTTHNSSLPCHTPCTPLCCRPSLLQISFPYNSRTPSGGSCVAKSDMALINLQAFRGMSCKSGASKYLISMSSLNLVILFFCCVLMDASIGSRAFMQPSTLESGILTLLSLSNSLLSLKPLPLSPPNPCQGFSLV